MRLNEIEDGADVVISVKIEKQVMEFNSVVEGKNKNNIMLNNVKVNDKVVSFDAKKMNIDIILIRQDKAPIIWKNVLCETVVYNNKTCYKITAFADGFEYNRRHTFRIFVGCSGIAQLGINSKGLDVIVRDVSECGFSFVSAEDHEKIISLPVRLVFTDLNINFNLMGTVVRKAKINDKKFLYGCKMSKESEILRKYVVDKQRHMMALNKNNNMKKNIEKLKNSLTEPKKDAKKVIDEAKNNK